jgi:hypothetical protein
MPLINSASVKKAMAPHLRGIFGNWWFHQFDTSKEVSRSARQAFESSFPATKRAEVLKFCQAQFFDEVKENIKAQPATLSIL